MTACRHSWTLLSRTEFKTERECIHCGLLKVHKIGANCHWTEWWKPGGLDGMPTRIESEHTPACEPVEAGVAG